MGLLVWILLKKGGVKNMADDNQGFAGMDPQKQHDIASKGGHSQGQQNNPGNFAKDPQRASDAGQKGGKAAQQSGNAHQLTDEDRSKGGQTSSSEQDMSELGRKGGNR